MAGTIYFIQGIDGGPIKIGFTIGDVDERRRMLQCGSPVRLQVLASMKGSRYDEVRLHRRFRHLRQHNEWFLAELDLLDFIAGSAEPWSATPPVRRGWPWEPWTPTAKVIEELGASFIASAEKQRLVELEKLEVKEAAKAVRRLQRFA